MSPPPKIRLERLPKRDTVPRLRAVYALLERSWQARQRAAKQQKQIKTSNLEVRSRLWVRVWDPDIGKLTEERVVDRA